MTYKNYIKRLLDIILSVLVILLMSPIILCLITIFWLQRYDNKTIFFKQIRVGYENKVFEIYKFRTMKDLYDKNHILLPDHERMTKFGNFLRKTSLDELPTLWNVIKGEMSFVGPRPLLVEYLPLYNAEQIRRHNVKPGITGWAQINGRNSISWEDKFKLDLWYIDNQSFILDMKILFLTFWKVIARKDINQSENITMPKFSGSE